MEDNKSIAVFDFPMSKLTFLSEDEILLLTYEKCSEKYPM